MVIVKTDNPVNPGLDELMFLFSCVPHSEHAGQRALIKDILFNPFVIFDIVPYIFRTRKNLESGLTLREGGLAQGFKPTVDGKNYNKKYLTSKNNKNINLCWFGELFCTLTLFFDHMDHSDLHWRILFYNRFD